MGSSPRMRGKRARFSPCVVASRFIPAHAGKTRALSGTRSTRRVHPRACGENADLLGDRLLPVGSSPRMRGKRPASEPAPPLRRFIPAHAGKTANANRLVAGG